MFFSSTSGVVASPVAMRKNNVHAAVLARIVFSTCRVEVMEGEAL
jgi:hypothetical protein